MLYAILVEGGGALGSVFDRDDFKASEIGDTDSDGLPEFIDAWGHPLQFFRWPIMYRSDSQKGFAPSPGPYGSIFEAREQDPLDPNQQLMAPAWWSSGTNSNAANFGTTTGPTAVTGMSNSAIAFQNIFHALAEPLVAYQASGANPTHFWDRSNNYYARRAFFSKPLIISGGLDGQVGIGMCGINYPAINPDSPSGDTSGAVLAPTLAHVLLENEAIQGDPNRPSNLWTINSTTGLYSNPTTLFLQNAGGDDISNYNLSAPGGVVQ